MIRIADITTEEKEQLKKEINAPFIVTSISTLGGLARASLCIKISLDPKEKWINNIYMNSRWMHFWLESDGSLKQSSRASNIPKFRKTKAENLKEVITKINKYLQKIS